MAGFLGRAGRRVDSPRERSLADRLEQSMAAGPYEARPLTIHASPFLLDTAAYLRAAAGPPAWSKRLLRIQRLSAELRERLDDAWLDHRRRCDGHADGPATDWRALVAGIDLSEINELIDKHNLYYPIEAGLHMHWPSGRYILPEGVEFPLAQVTAEALAMEYAAATE